MGKERKWEEEKGEGERKGVREKGGDEGMK